MGTSIQVVRIDKIFNTIEGYYESHKGEMLLKVYNESMLRNEYIKPKYIIGEVIKY